ncbi:conserved hypothetical protein [Hyphomicrobiales bacterium]|nr:conserved hypothetical protein [Hyphomicrobiales bacterium]CAH1661608.1 conserved hypothetical protein [Hyphomicrobiales bacterium]CAH1664257.1 conserved hypothetical protein [Hyphomicrobiales bacterium]CAH1667626.1 conserved hypothetical protein [Hyphomicrobiales bacterium]
MADSAIVIASVSKAGGAGQITLLVGTSGGGEDECLIYMTLNRVEIYASKTNNRATATKIGDTIGTFVHGNLGVSETWYYWFRAIDNNTPPLVGEWYPFSPTDGVVATTSNQVPPPNSVGTTQLQDGAATAQKIANLAVGSAHIQALAVKTANIDNLQVTDAKMVSMSAAKLTAGVITATITMSTPVINGGSINGARLTLSGGNFNSPMIDLGGVAQTNISTVRLTQAGANSEAVLWAINSGAGTTCHGIRGTKTLIPGGDVSSGLVGAANGRAFYAEIGTYGPFTGSHDAFIDKDAVTTLGDIVCDVRVIARKGINDTITEVKLCDAVGMKSAVGVISMRSAFDPSTVLATFIETANTACNFLRRYCTERFDFLVMNGLGDGLLNVCGRGGDLQPGDLICTSDLAGKGQRQADDLVRASTVAKVREAVTFSDPDEVKLVACIYLCG